MAACGELILQDGLLADIERFLAVELLGYDEQLGFRVLLFLLLGLDEGHVAAPATRAALALLVFAVQLVQVFVAQQNVVSTESQEEVVAVFVVVVFCQLVDGVQGIFLAVLRHPRLQLLLADFLHLAVVASEDGLYLSLGLGRRHEVDPVGLYVLRFRRENLHLVAALQFVAQGYELMVHLGADAVGAEEGVDAEGEIEGRAAGGHGLNLALWREDEYLAGKEVQLDGVEEVHGVGLWVVKNFLDGAQPLVQLGLVLGVLLFLVVALLVFPVGGQSLFGNLVHAVRAYLHLYPVSLFRHQRDVQCLIAVGLGVVEPVAQTVGVTLVNF